MVLNGFPGENLNRLVVLHTLEPKWSILIYIIDVAYFNWIYHVPHCFMGAVVFPIQMFATLVWIFSKWHFPSHDLIWRNRLIHENLRTGEVCSVCWRERSPEEDRMFNYLLFVSWSLSFLNKNPGVGDTVHVTFKGSIYFFFNIPYAAHLYSIFQNTSFPKQFPAAYSVCGRLVYEEWAKGGKE